MHYEEYHKLSSVNRFVFFYALIENGAFLYSIILKFIKAKQLYYVIYKQRVTV